MEFFTDQQIEYYKKYFNLPKVVDGANKIVDAVKLSDELKGEEKRASVILSYIKLQEYYKEKNNK